MMASYSTIRISMKNLYAGFYVDSEDSFESVSLDTVQLSPMATSVPEIKPR